MERNADNLNNTSSKISWYFPILIRGHDYVQGWKYFHGSVYYSVYIRERKQHWLKYRFIECKGYLLTRLHDPQLVQEQFDRANKLQGSALLNPAKNGSQIPSSP
ncbi:hypothetical protein HOLleu_22082 [Holothuria leucospilota]|uniref:Uncharacterized protein n=1 Tax=Holothuria leucospilota TaxID=206669 RepID=A0A9Q1H6I6_HOLLE|nr:hypothetical protein HOLleu_22082 [Holothuria leucospilota]